MFSFGRERRGLASGDGEDVVDEEEGEEWVMVATVLRREARIASDPWTW